jgi:hypothetical protein
MEGRWTYMTVCCMHTLAFFKVFKKILQCHLSLYYTSYKEKGGGEVYSGMYIIIFTIEKNICGCRYE